MLLSCKLICLRLNATPPPTHSDTKTQTLSDEFIMAATAGIFKKNLLFWIYFILWRDRALIHQIQRGGGNSHLILLNSSYQSESQGRRMEKDGKYICILGRSVYVFVWFVFDFAFFVLWVTSLHHMMSTLFHLVCFTYFFMHSACISWFVLLFVVLIVFFFIFPYFP